MDEVADIGSRTDLPFCPTHGYSVGLSHRGWRCVHCDHEWTDAAVSSPPSTDPEVVRSELIESNRTDPPSDERPPGTFSETARRTAAWVERQHPNTIAQMLVSLRRDRRELRRKVRQHHDQFRALEAKHRQGAADR